MNNIMIIGGYGQVGSYITKKLLSGNKKELNLINLIVAGRNISKAQDVLKKQNNKCEVRKVDVENIDSNEFKNIDTVIMCLENNNEGILKECIKNKINYIDITPSYAIMESILTHQTEIEEAGIVVMLGVGISPGISNLLVKRAAGEFDEVSDIDSYLMLGVGEVHGKDAVKWLVNNLNVIYEVDTKNTREKVKSFTQVRKVVVEKNKKAHSFTRIDLADSYINKKMYPQAQINSWFSYDVNCFTTLMRVMTKLGLFHFIHNQKVNMFYRRLFGFTMRIAQKMKIGTAKYASIVRVRGKRNENNQEIDIRVNGYCNNEITAYAAAYLARKVSDQQPGIHYASEIVDIDEMNIKYYMVLQDS